MRHGILTATYFIVCGLVGCTVGEPELGDIDGGGDGGSNSEPNRSLNPVSDFREDGFIFRWHPTSLELSKDEKTIFVSLAGTDIEPAHEILALNTQSGAEIARIKVGSSPNGMVQSEDGSRLYVTNRFSNFVSVVDVEKLAVVAEIRVSFYAQDLVVKNKKLYIANRFHDAVEVVELDDQDGGKVVALIPVGRNPRDLVFGPDGFLYVGNLAGTSISLVDVDAGKEIDRLHTNSPINGLASDASQVYVATLGRGDGHEKVTGTNTDRGVDYRGDSTANTGFADINNDVMVLGSAIKGHVNPLARYTSDTAEILSHDVKGDFTTAEMIVAGALPEQAAVRNGRLFVSMSSSNSVQVFEIAPGKLSHLTVLDCGTNPFEVAITSDGATVYTADRLGESISKIDVASNTRTTWMVDPRAATYPANDYEIGEMLFHSALFSAEALPSSVFPEGDKTGDASCNHCHRETLTDGKVWSVGVGLLVPVGGERLPPAARNIRDTMSLFWEGVQDQTDFDLETNEFAPPDDFDCDPVATEIDPASCVAREQFFMAQTGYTFSKVAEDLIGKFLVGRPHLLPNPNAQFPSSDAAESIARGRELFNSTEVACSSCHPSTSSEGPIIFTNNGTIAPVISPSGLDKGLIFKDEVDGNVNIPSLRGVWDRPAVYLHDGRARSLRSAILPPGHQALTIGLDGCQKLADYQGFFKDGLPRSILDGRGCNELDGALGTHGQTTHLTSTQVDDLIAFIESIE